MGEFWEKVPGRARREGWRGGPGEQAEGKRSAPGGSISEHRMAPVMSNISP